MGFMISIAASYEVEKSKVFEKNNIKLQPDITLLGKSFSIDSKGRVREVMVGLEKLSDPLINPFDFYPFIFGKFFKFLMLRTISVKYIDKIRAT